MKNAILIVACLVAVCTPSLAAAQTGMPPKTAEQVKKDVEQTQAIKTKIDEAQAKDNPRFVRTLTNVQIELTLTDQIGTGRAGEEDRVDDRVERQLGQDSLGRGRAPDRRCAVSCRC